MLSLAADKRTDVEMRLGAQPKLSIVGAAFCGAVLASMAVIMHEVYTVFYGFCPGVDPLTHILAEFAIFAPTGALLLAAGTKLCNWLLQPAGA